MATDKIMLDQGSGGRSSHELIEKFFLPRLGNSYLNELNDSAVIELEGGKLAFTTDSFVVDPIFFPGGDIGTLAICGTVNDLSMRGARPLYLSIGFIIEEGFLLKELKQIFLSIEETALEAGIQIVTGDTKIVPKGAADKIFINTSGIGLVPPNINIAGQNAKPGDVVLINGNIGDHGMTILNSRENLFPDSPIKSDASPLNHLVQKMLITGSEIHVLRDPTRGGLGTTLNEIASQSQVGIEIIEEAIPINKSVLAASEILGLDPLYMANEGKLVAFVPESDAETVLAAMKETSFGSNAAIIGYVKAQKPGKVIMETSIGGKRIVDMLTGEQLPRIC